MAYKSRVVYIYGLYDPRNVDVIKYVGKTIDPRRRFLEHIHDALSSPDNPNPKCIWISALLNLGLKPVMKVVEEVSEDEWEKREKFWITHYGKDNLLNLSPGGAIGSGADPERTKESWCNDEVRERRLKGMRMSWVDPETRKRRMYAIQHPDRKRKISIASKKSWQDEELRQRRIVSMRAHYDNDNAARKRAGQKSVEMWKDPSRKENYLKFLERYWSDPQNHKKHSEATSRSWTEERRKIQSEISKEMWKDPERQKRRLEKIRKFWDDPIRKAEALRKMQDTKERNLRDK